jgi:hypothetical protein
MTIFALRSFMSSTIQFESHALPAIKPANLMSSIGVRRHRCHAGVMPVTWRRDEPRQSQEHRPRQDFGGPAAL